MRIYPGENRRLVENRKKKNKKKERIFLRVYCFGLLAIIIMCILI